MTPDELDHANRCQRALDNAASERMQALPAVSREFGHDPAQMLRRANEAALDITGRAWSAKSDG